MFPSTARTSLYVGGDPDERMVSPERVAQNCTTTGPLLLEQKFQGNLQLPEQETPLTLLKAEFRWPVPARTPIIISKCFFKLSNGALDLLHPPRGALLLHFLWRYNLSPDSDFGRFLLNLQQASLHTPSPDNPGTSLPLSACLVGQRCLITATNAIGAWHSGV